MFYLNGHPPLLIIDPDTNYTEKLKQQPYASLNPPHTATHAQEAESYIVKQKMLSGVFISSKLDAAEILKIVKKCHSVHVGTPIYLMKDSESPQLVQEKFHDLGISESIPKPNTFAELMKIVAPIADEFDTSDILRKAEEALEPLQKEFAESDGHFIPILAHNFLFGKKSLFSIYLRIGTNKYIKVLHRNESFDSKRLENYFLKGLTHFYLRKEDQQRYIDFCDVITRSLSKSQAISKNVKTSTILNFGEQVLLSLKTRYVESETLERSLEYLERLDHIVSDPAFTQNLNVRNFMKNIALFQHGVGCSLIAFMMARQMGIHNERLLNIIGVASLFQDIALLQHREPVAEGKTSKMSIKEQLIYQRHPINSAKMLSQISTIEPAVLQTVEQHHERRSGHGFPRQLPSGAISRISEIVGASNEIFKIITELKDEPQQKFINTLEERYFNEFSFPIINATESIFQIKSSKNS